MSSAADVASEVQPLAGARSGDRRALNHLLELEQGRIYRFGLQMCRSPGDASDVTQETLLALARGLETFRGDASLSTWLYTVARSFCLKKRRRRRHAPARVESLDADEDRGARDIPNQQKLPKKQLTIKRSSAPSRPPWEISSPPSGRWFCCETSRGSRRQKSPRSSASG